MLLLRKLNAYWPQALGLGIIFACATIAFVLAREEKAPAAPSPVQNVSSSREPQTLEQAVLEYYARSHEGDRDVSLRLIKTDCCGCTYEVLKNGQRVSTIMYMDGRFREAN